MPAVTEETAKPQGQLNVTAFPDELKARLRLAADESGVTMSAFVVSLLDTHLPPLPRR